MAGERSEDLPRRLLHELTWARPRRHPHGVSEPYPLGEDEFFVLGRQQPGVERFAILGRQPRGAGLPCSWESRSSCICRGRSVALEVFGRSLTGFPIPGESGTFVRSGLPVAARLHARHEHAGKLDLEETGGHLAVRTRPD